MAFQQFTFPRVLEQLGLTLRDSELLSVPAAELPADFVEYIQAGAALAAANSTEKARSEFVIAPVLFRLYAMSNQSFRLFSGVEWDADSERGLNGFCDFLLTRGPSRYTLGPPFVAVVEAKNELVRSGLGQCIAAMVGARVCNERDGRPDAPVFGVVTTGTAWQFLRLEGTAVTVLHPELSVGGQLPRVMGVLRHFVELGAS